MRQMNEEFKASWYQAIRPRDRAAVDAVAAWVRPINWQWFITLTFPWNVRSETADRKLKQFINDLERRLRTSVCVVAGKEAKAISNGINVPWHFHLLMTSTVPIPLVVIRETWHRFVRLRLPDRTSVPVSDSVLIEEYNGAEKGPEYCLKSMNDCRGDWFNWNLREFNPEVGGTSRPNHRSVRAARRAQARRAKAGKLCFGTTNLVQHDCSGGNIH